MAISVSITQAKLDLAALVARSEAGEEIILTRDGAPVAKLMGLVPRPVVYGDLQGLWMADDLSLPEELLSAFEPKMDQQ